MIHSRTLGLLILGAAFVVGCNKDDNKKSTTPGVPNPAPVHPSPQAGPSASNTLPQAGTSASNTAPPVSTITPGPSATAPATQPTASTEATADAQAMIQAVQDDVRAGKWNTAEKDVKKLDRVKGQLSTQMRTTIDALHDEILAGKAIHSVKIPGVTGGPATKPSAPSDTEINK